MFRFFPQIIVSGVLVFLVGCGGGESTISSTPVTTPVTSTPEETPGNPLFFVEATQRLGLSHQWGLEGVNATGIQLDSAHVAGGIAIGDYDNDGLIDLFIVGGNISTTKLYRLQSNGQYQDVAAQAGVQFSGHYSGPSFADTDNDGDLDLFVGGLLDTPSRFFINNGAGQFIEAGEGLSVSQPFTISSSFGDINNDGLPDLALSHYGSEVRSATEHLWLNIGQNQFIDISQSSGILQSSLDASTVNRDHDVSFTPSFGDMDNDGQMDLLMASDFFHSVYLHNINGTFFETLTEQLNIKRADLHGMGATIADVNNDGYLDWFVTNITQFQSQNGGLKYTGNKLFLNNGDNSFEDVSYEANIFNGGWGWASCVADFNNDGLPDLFNTNGWNQSSTASGQYESHEHDTVALFLASESGKYTKLNQEVGLTHQGQGRGVICFDQDNDGDIDILLFNHDSNQNALLFYENQLSGQNYLNLTLRSNYGNAYALGARVWVEANNLRQMKEVNINSNFISQTLNQLHFGLAEATTISSITINWPDGQQQILQDVAVNQNLTVFQE